MTILTGTKTIYDDANAQRIDVSDVLGMLDVLKDIPFTSQYGAAASLAKAHKHEWNSKEYPGNSTTINDSGGISDTDTTVVVTESRIFRKGSIVQIENEYVYVSAVVPSTHTLTITRAYAGTTNVAHADALTIYLRGVAATGTSDASADDARDISLDREFNYVQTFQYPVSVSDEDNAVATYIPTNDLNTQIQDTLKTAARDLEVALFYGKRYVGTKTVPASFAGIRSYIATANLYNASSADLTDTMIVDVLRTKTWPNGGKPSLLVCNGYNRQRISNFNDAITRTNPDDKVRGSIVDKLVSDFGVLYVMLNRWIDASDVFLLDMDDIKYGTLAGPNTGAFAYEVLARTGNYVKGMITGYYTTELKCPKAHAVIYGTKTS